MVIQRQYGGGTGVVQPRVLPDTTPAIYSYPSLKVAAQAEWYQDASYKAASSSPYGSLTGGLTFNQLYSDYTRDPWTPAAPSKHLAAPILTKDIFSSESPSSPGNFSLSLIRPWDSLYDAWTGGLGQEWDFGNPESNPLFDFLAWSGQQPVKMLDKAAAPFTLMWSKVTGSALPTPNLEDRRYPFQKFPTYYAWVAKATPEQLAQEAQAVAGQYISNGRNGALAAALLHTFEQDKQVALGLSSGSDRADYMAKKNLEAYMKLGADRYSIRAIVEAGGSFDRTAVTAIPFVGTQIAQVLSPVTDEVETAWRNLSVAERQSLLQDATMQGTLGDIAITLPILGGVGMIARLVQVGRLGAGVPHLATIAKAYNLSLDVLNVTMAYGVASQVAYWSMYTFSPFEQVRELGRELDAAAPFSASPYGAYINVYAGLASGTAGAYTAGKLGLWLPRALASDTKFGAKVWGTPELQYSLDVYGGSGMYRTFREFAGVSEEQSRLAAGSSLLSFLVRGTRDEMRAVYESLMRGEATGIGAIDNEPTAALRVARANDMLLRMYSDSHTNTLRWVERIGRTMGAGKVIQSDRAVQTQRAMQAAVRKAIDIETRKQIDLYGAGYWPANVAELAQIVEQRLRAAGLEPNMGGMLRRLGQRNSVANVAKWQQAARLAHQVGFVREHATLQEILRSGDTTEQALTLFSQRHLAQQDIEAALPLLVKPTDTTVAWDPALAKQTAIDLLTKKEDLQVAFASRLHGDINNVDPGELAAYLVAMHEAVPRRRDLPDPNLSNDGTLNAFHRRINVDGNWDLGFRARVPLPKEYTYHAALYELLSPREFAMENPGLVRVLTTDIPPPGHVEINPNTRLQRRNWPEAELFITRDGHWWIKDDGKTINASTGLPWHPQPRYPGAPTSSRRPGVPIDESSPDWNTLTDAQKTLVRPYDSLSPELNSVGSYTLTQVTHADGTPMVLTGRNAGAEWPVLENYIGEKFLFKAGKADVFGNLTSQSKPRIWADVAATKLATYLGVRTGEARYYRWNNTDGTIQPLLDVADHIDLNHLDYYRPETITEVAKHNIIDWLVANHDTNNDSGFILDDGTVAFVDKAQAWAFPQTGPSHPYYRLADGEQFAFEQPGFGGDKFWGYIGSPGGDTHLEAFLGHFIRTQGGSVPNLRSDLEPLLQRIEELPDDVYLGLLKPLAEARELDGRFTSADEFYRWALARKHQMRDAINNAYAHEGYLRIEAPGMPQSWVPIDSLRGTYMVEGSTIPVNTPAFAVGLSKQGVIDEPPLPPTRSHYKAGVVVREPDGRIWVISPKNHYQGYENTWPKGGVDETVGETMQQAAIREAQEELGLTVRLTEYLGDAPNEAGNMTRYYLAERLAGGPSYLRTPDEVGYVRLISKDQARRMLTQNGTPNPRDQAILDALDDWERQQGTTAAAQAQGTTNVSGTSAPHPMSEPDPSPTDPEMGFVSYAKLPDGSIYHSPWLDVPVEEAAQLNLGDRGVVGHLFDDAFRGWRSWRLIEAMRARLHFQLQDKYPGITPAQVDRFHQGLLNIQAEARVGPDFSPMHPSMQSMTVMGAEQDKIVNLAREIFGTGPIMDKKGNLVTPNWKREVRTAYRTSVRLNALAGVTSYIKTIPGIGSAIIPVSDFIYPMLRFGVSPFFKAGEYFESAWNNLMRGAPVTGDPFIDALYYHAGAGRAINPLMDDFAQDMILQGISGFYSPQYAGRTSSKAPFFYERLDAGELARRTYNELSPSQPYAPKPPLSDLGESLYPGRRLQTPGDDFPDVFGEYTPHTLLDTYVDPDTAELSMVSSGRRTAAQVAEFRDAATKEYIRMLTSSDLTDAAALGRGFAFLESLPPGTVEAMAASILPQHTPVTSNYRGHPVARQIEFMEQGISEGFPVFSGLWTAKNESVHFRAAEAGGVVGVGHSTDTGHSSISGNEAYVGFGDAKYGGHDYYSMGPESMQVLLKPHMYRESVTVDTDRIGYGNDLQTLKQQMMTPAAINAKNRILVQKALVDFARTAGPNDTFVDFLGRHWSEYWSSITPFEHAYMRGIGLEDIDAIVIPASEAHLWQDFLTRHAADPRVLTPDGRNMLADIKLLLHSGSSGDAHRIIVAHQLERAGLSDLGVTTPPVIDDVTALASLPSFAVTPRNVNLGSLTHYVDSILQRADVQYERTFGWVDKVDDAIHSVRNEIRDSERHIEKKVVEPSGQGSASYYEREIVGQRQRLSDLEALRADMAEFWATSPFPTEAAMMKAVNAGDTEASAWYSQLSALGTRLNSIFGGSVYDLRGGAFGRGIIKRGDEVLDERPWGDFSATEYARDPTVSPADYREALEAQHVLDWWQANKPPGYALQANPRWMSSTDSYAAVQGLIVPPTFRQAIKRTAEQKLGLELPEPVISVYMRGDQLKDTTFPGEAIIVVRSADGTPYGNLSLLEIEDLWRQQGLPANFRARGEMAGWNGATTHNVGYTDVMWSPDGPTNAGTIFVYPPGTRTGGNWEARGNDHAWVDAADPTNRYYGQQQKALAVSFAYRFEPRKQGYIDTTSGLYWDNAGYNVHKGVASQEGMTFVSRLSGDPRLDFEYQVQPYGDSALTVLVTRWPTGGTPAELGLYRDLFERFPDKALRIPLDDEAQLAGIGRMWSSGELPPTTIVIKPDGWVMEQADFVSLFGNRGAKSVEFIPEPDSLADVKGTPESVTARLDAEFTAEYERVGEAFREGFERWFNPIPFKGNRANELQFDLIRRKFPLILREDAPEVAKVFDDLKIPEGAWSDFVLVDRYLMSRWLKSGSRDDWEALVMHATKYDKSADATRESLHSLYSDQRFETLIEAWRLTVKGTEDEAYSAHFFSPMRSTFERSINHPIFGIYPASWAFRQAKEWARFLFDNRTFGIRLGMAPNQLIQQIVDQQAEFFAQHNDTTLDDFLERGPFSSGIFIFNLLMPGDWSNLPFPASRSIRDLVRGQVNLYDMFDRNIAAMGTGRDIRLSVEAAQEMYNFATGNEGNLPKQFTRASSINDYSGLPQAPNEYSYGDISTVRNYYTYR